MNVALTPEDSYHKACQHYTQQRYASAREICRQVLSVDPGHMHAAYLMEVIEHRLGAAESGDQFLRQALSRRPYSVRLTYLPPGGPRYAELPHPGLNALLSQRLDHYIEVLQSFAAW